MLYIFRTLGCHNYPAEFTRFMLGITSHIGNTVFGYYSLNIYDYSMLGITRDVYRNLTRVGDFEWRCTNCNEHMTDVQPIFESTRQSFEISGNNSDDDDLTMLSLESAASAPNNSDICDPSRLYNEPLNYEESLLHGADSVEVEDEPSVELTWTLVKGATERSGCRLINSLGYSYILLRKGKKDGTAYWRCSKRNSAQCKARVNQHGDRFTPGANEHVCSVSRGIDVKTKVQVACLKRAREQPFTAARRIVDEVVRELVPIDRPMEQFNPEYLA